jgi:hypothetical protein
VRIRFRPALTAGSRKLYSNAEFGQPVYAATDIRRRVIILDRDLEGHSRELARILTHELFHFAWVRLGNPARRSFEALLRDELERRGRGELGWSAELRKVRIKRDPRSATKDPKKWRDYACESFCDTAAWLYSGIRSHPEFTLAARHRRRRADWFASQFPDRRIPI